MLTWLKSVLWTQLDEYAAKLKHESSLRIRLAAASDEEERFAVFYRLYWNAGIHVCRNLLVSREDAEEVVSIAFSVLWKNLAGINNEKEMLVCYCRLLQQAIITFKRQRVRNQVAFSLEDMKFELSAQQWAMEEKMDYQKMLQSVIAAVTELPHQQQQVFNMRVFEGKSHKEIAAHLNIGLSTAMNHFTEAKKRIRKTLGRK